MDIAYNSDTIRINVSLPKDLLAELKKKLPARGLSSFLSEAAREKIRRMEQEKALNELLDAPVTYEHVKDTAGYVHDMRKSDEKRSKRLKI